MHGVGALDDATRRELFRIMVLIRAFDHALGRESGRGPGGGGAGRTYLGLEPLAAGLGVELNPDDAVTAVSWSHHLAIARGTPLHVVVNDALRSVHGFDHESADEPGVSVASAGAGRRGSQAIGAGYLPALGRAFAFQQAGTEQIAASVIDRSAAQEEGFRSAVNLASLWKLPVVFVIEDQDGDSAPARSGEGSAGTLSEAFDIPGERVEYDAVEAVCTAARRAVTRARSGGGPSIVDVHTVRIGQDTTGRGRTGYLPDVYDVVAQDPLPAYELVLRQSGLVDDERLAQIRTEATYRVARAISDVVESHGHSPHGCPVCARKAAS